MLCFLNIYPNHGCTKRGYSMTHTERSSPQPKSVVAVVSLLLLAMVFAPAIGFTIWKFCFALPAFISWLIGGITVGFVCPQLEKMHSGKASPLTCFGGRTGLWFSYHCHIEAFGATVPSPPCVKSSSNPRHPVGGATRHHMHHRYPPRLHHCMAFHDRPHPLILPWLANPYLCLGQCLLDWCMYSFQVWFAPVYVTDVPHQEGEDPSFQRFKNRPQLAKCHHRHFWTRPQLHKRQHRPFAPSCH